MTQYKTSDSSYRIGAVSRLTGVPADTLRVWERRYAVVEPSRTEGGSRLYSQEDVARLSLIKRLVDAGHAIGTVANLSLEQLEVRAAGVQAAGGTHETRGRGPVALALVGATLPLRLERDLKHLDEQQIRLVGAFQELSDFEAEAAELDADVVVVELPTLDAESLSRVRRLQRLCGAREAVAVYGFGSSQYVHQLEDQGIAALHFPVSWDELRRACCPDGLIVKVERGEPTDFESALGSPVPARRFDDRQLAVASTASTAIKCECPHHLADLIIALARFEQYSVECENRTREDAALHAYLHVTTARARAMLEEALERVIEIEGIDVDRPAAV
jgi:DNA-binding transcriptional MerR regulator